jgi:4-amino-4-deoxy-L-arabinose transferase-like glycosyltransferase
VPVISESADQQISKSQISKPPITNRQSPIAGILLILLVAAGLLFASVPGRSLWIDELYTVREVAEPSIPVLVEQVIQAERRPPIHFLALHVWSGLVGSGETAQRAFSVACLLLSLPLVYLLGRRLGNEAVARWSLVLTAASPFLILYGPMVRAYSLTLLLGCLSTLAFLHWRERPTATSWLGYVVAALALIYTDYVGLALVLAQGLLGFGTRTNADGRGKNNDNPRFSAFVRVQFWAAFGLLALAYLPWVGVIVAQVGRPVLPADFAQSLSGYVLKIAYPLYSFSLGETIFPWQPAAVLGGLAVALLAVMALAFWREKPASAWTLAICLSVPLAFTIFLFSTFATDITFLNVASRTALAAPYFYIFLAGGLARLWAIAEQKPVFSKKTGFWAVVAFLAVAWVVSLANLYTSRQYHNPIYAVPMRQIVQQVVADSRPGDVVVADPDSIFDHYLAQTSSALLLLSSVEADTLPGLQAAPPPRLWLVTLGRDRTRAMEPTALLAWLAENYRLAESRGYVPQDPLYQRFKQLLLHRPDYDYKALVRLYVR